MPDEAIWQPVKAALDRSADRGRTVEIWLRDDDAISHTPALDRLAGLSRTYDLPVLLAVIPDGADESLAAFMAAHPEFMPTQHGFRHANHAAPGERARELGGLRPLDTVRDELHRGRERMRMLFGPTAADILVPPWNRIDDEVLQALPALGFTALSTFGPPMNAVDGLTVLNTDLDIIDWRNRRICRPFAKLADRLASLIASRMDIPGPIGLLTHHLVHDDPAWRFLDGCLSYLRAHPAVRLEDAAALLARAARRTTHSDSDQCTDAL